MDEAPPTEEVHHCTPPLRAHLATFTSSRASQALNPKNSSPGEGHQPNTEETIHRSKQQSSNDGYQHSRGIIRRKECRQGFQEGSWTRGVQNASHQNYSPPR